ncbi:HpcH/HpaI aldolase/citrate lyase family protein [Variovorax boronicumulans]
MLRSFLFVPADSQRKLEKALATSADALILDLEDAVALDRKAIARSMAVEFLANPRGGKKVYVRINALDTGMALEDLRVTMSGQPDGIVLPKSRSGRDVEKLGNWLDAFEASFSFEGLTSIIPIVTETPEAMMHLHSYVGCGPRVWGLLWGAEDLASAVGASANRHKGRYRSPFRLARDQCLMAAAAAQVVAIDAVYVDVGNLEGLEAEATDSRIDGFGAKAAIHPAHCSVINEAFEPTSAEIEWAQRVLNALSKTTSGGVVMLDGMMIDKPHEVQARRLLARIEIARQHEG